MIGRLIVKDLRRRVKNPGGFLLLLALPLMFSLLLGLLFGPGRDDASIIQVQLLIEDHDRSFVSQFVSGAFSQGQLADMFTVTMADSGLGRPLMDDGKASALLIIPAGFADSLLNRAPLTLELVKNPSEAFAPRIAEETVSIMAEGLDRLLRAAEKPLAMIQEQREQNADVSEALVAATAVEVYQLTSKFDTYLIPPKIKISTRTAADDGETRDYTAGQIYAFILSGIVVMTLFFSLEVLARDLFIEKEQGTLYRILIGPAGVSTFVLAKMIFLIISGFFAHTMVWILGSVFFGIRLGAVQIFTLLVFSLFIIAALSGVISMIYSMARTRDQAQSMSPAFIIAFSMLGGSMINIEALPVFLQRAAVISPVYWGVKGLKSIVLDSDGLLQLTLHMAVLGAAAAVSAVLSFILFKRKYRV